MAYSPKGNVSLPLIQFVTLLASEPLPWVALSTIQNSLEQAWRISPEWRVGHYLLTPSVLHFFCAPMLAGAAFESWMKSWRARFALCAASAAWGWQDSHWRCELAPDDCYRRRWEFLREHPVREGWVSQADDWPHQGAIVDLLSVIGPNKP